MSLKGYRTYILAIAGVLISGAAYMGYIDQTLATQLLTLIGFGGLATLRAAVR